MQSIRFSPEALSDEQLFVELWEKNTAGIIENPNGLQAFFADDEDLSELVQRRADLITEASKVDECLHPAFTHASWDGILVGERFHIAPSWVQETTPEGRIRLSLDTSSAFGTGRHETTQLMLEYLEANLRPEHVVIDVGCGSGILAMAARLLGASSTFGCDIDERAVADAKSFSGADLFAGSADAVAGDLADIVLVNISARVIDELAGQLKRIVKPEGQIVASGFIGANVPKRLSPELITERGEWQCWICRPTQVEVTAEEEGQLLSHSLFWW